MLKALFIYFPFQPQIDQEMWPRRFYVGSTEDWAKEMVLGGDAYGLTADNCYQQLISITLTTDSGTRDYKQALWTIESGPYKRERVSGGDLPSLIGSCLGTHATDEVWELVVKSWFS